MRGVEVCTYKTELHFKQHCGNGILENWSGSQFHHTIYSHGPPLPQNYIKKDFSRESPVHQGLLNLHFSAVGIV